MILNQPNNIWGSNYLIQDESNSPKRLNNSAFLPLYPLNSNNFPSKIINTYFPLLINNYKQDDSLTQTKLNKIPSDKMTQKSNVTYNIKTQANNCMIASTNSNDDASYENKSTSRQDLRINQAKDSNNDNTNIKKFKILNKFKFITLNSNKFRKKKLHLLISLNIRENINLMI